MYVIAGGVGVAWVITAWQKRTDEEGPKSEGEYVSHQCNDKFVPCDLTVIFRSMHQCSYSQLLFCFSFTFTLMNHLD